MRNKGLSLLEVIIYLGIIVFVIPTVTILILGVVKSNVTSKYTRELDLEGLRALQLITKAIRNSYSISYPEIGQSSNTCTVIDSSSPSDTTKFIVDNGRLTISEDGGGLLPITSDKVTVSNFLCTNVSKFATPGALTISFKIRSKDQEKNFYVSSALRKK